jgi:hypothetical protein
MDGIIVKPLWVELKIANIKISAYGWTTHCRRCQAEDIEVQAYE